ncbi:MAG TPA: histidine phosphatase family protein, partial [Pyrinomonadaceae bacterium]
MKTLFLLRHAKSSWKAADVADFDRPLNERGRRAAPFMGRLLLERGLAPERIVSSPARRARKTAKLFKEAGDLDADIVFDDRIYEASPSALLYVASEVDDSVNSMMLVGHNPGMEGAIRALTNRIEPMPTAAVAVIDLKIDSWKQIASGC